MLTSTNLIMQSTYVFVRHQGNRDSGVVVASTVRTYITSPIYIYFSLNHAGVIDGATLQSNYETAQAIDSEPIYDTIIYDRIDEEGQENIEMSPLNTATVSTI